MPARKPMKPKRNKRTQPVVKRIAKKQHLKRPLTAASLRKTLPSSVTNYFDFLDGKGGDPCARIPARSSRMSTPFTAMYRFLVNTDAAQSSQIAVNTHYTPDGVVVRMPTNLDAMYAAVSYGALNDATPINPYTYESSSTLTMPVNPLVQTYRTAAALDVKGNMPGLQRLRGVRLTIVPRGTLLNAGGEVFILHSPYTNNIAGMTSNDIFAHPDTRRFSIASNKPVHFTSGPLRRRHEFIEIREFANSDNTAYPSSTSADADVFGDGHTNTGGTTHYASDGYKGWDLGIVIKSAVAGQTYEVQLQCFFDLLRTEPSPTFTAGNSGKPIVAPTAVVHANQSIVDLIDGAHASQVLSRVHAMGSQSQNSSIWPHVEATAKVLASHLFETGVGYLMAA